MHDTAEGDAVMPQVNRSLADPMMDDIDHALGRPRDPFGGYRDHYAADRDSLEAARMEESPYWHRWSQIDTKGQLVCFRVTRAGREALAEYLRNNTAATTPQKETR